MWNRGLRVLFALIVLSCNFVFASQADYMRTVGDDEWITINQPMYIDPPGQDGVTGFYLDYANMNIMSPPQHGSVHLDRETYFIYIPDTRGIVQDCFQYQVLDAYGFAVYYQVDIHSRTQVTIKRLSREEESF